MSRFRGGGQTLGLAVALHRVLILFGGGPGQTSVWVGWYGGTVRWTNTLTLVGSINFGWVGTGGGSNTWASRTPKKYTD